MEENICINLCDLELGNGFLDKTPKHKQQKKTTLMNQRYMIYVQRIQNICQKGAQQSQENNAWTEWKFQQLDRTHKKVLNKNHGEY